MSPSLPTGELRRSLSLFATEWWVLVGGLVGYLAYGCWVVGTGVALATVESLSTLESLALTGFVWLFVPAAVATWFLTRRFSNEHGNLRDRYRFAHPSALLWPPGVVMLGCLAVTLTASRSPAITLLALIASVFLLVRTIAYGYRVYTLSVPWLFSLLGLLSGVALSAAWLVQATMVAGLNATVRDGVADAGVGPVVEAVTAAAGVTPAAALAALVGVPAVLSAAYLLVQSVAGVVVRRQAPLADPIRRPGQRFPVMSPVTDGPSRKSAPDAGPDDVDTETVSESTADTDSAESAADGKPSQTRVFTPDDDASADSETRAIQTDTEESTDGFDDDTSVFSPEQAGCDNCGRAVPEAASVCPNCGERDGG